MTRTFHSSLVASCLLVTLALPVAAQPQLPAPADGGAPAAPSAAPVSPAPPEASAAPAAPVPAAPPAPTFNAPAAPAAPPPSSEPPVPRYEKLGGQPTPPVEEGEWNPWDHPQAGTREHDGFLLRIALGVGGGSLSGDDVTYSGGGFAWSLALGGSVGGGFAINADLYQTTLFNPSVNYDTLKDEDLGGDLTLNGFGVGATYYIDPANVYFALSIGFVNGLFENASGDRSSTKLGLGGHFIVGKEWWASEDWGIGIAGDATMMRMDDRTDGPLSALLFQVLFSATYN
jgi:hypothetical protein